jgi:hypothetical protein
MARRTIAAAALGLALAGCTTAPQPLWPGADWQTAQPAPAPPVVATTTEPEAPDAGAPARDDSPVRVPKVRTRRGSGTPPDILFPGETEPRPSALQPAAPSTPVAPVDTSNPVLSPRDPTKPYSAQGYGYQRSGTTVQGPNGTTYNMVGKTFFGTNGATCHAVGASLFCN